MTLALHFQHMKSMVCASTPIMIGMFADMAIGITDTIMVGHLGETALASLGAANALLMICMMFAFGIGSMSAAFLPQALAQGDAKHTQDTVHGVVAATIIATIITFLIMIDPHSLLVLVGQPQTIIGDATDYLEIRRFSLLVLCFTVVYRGFISSIGLQYYLTYISVGGLLLNILLNYIFIYGHFGVPPMGVAGAAHASNIVVFVVFVVFYVIFRTQTRLPNINVFKGLLSTPPDAIWHTLKIAMPVSCAMVVEMLFWSGNSVMAGWLGVDVLAVHQIVGSIAAMSLAPMIAFATMIMIESGQLAGRKDRDDLKYMPLLGMMFMGCYGFILFAFVVGGVPWLAPRFLNVSPDVLTLLNSGTVTLAICLFGYGLYVSFSSVLKALNDTYVMLFISTTTFVVIGLSTGYTLGHILGYGIMGQWIGMIITTAITAGVFYLRFRWLHNHPEKIFNKVRYVEKPKTP